MQKFYWKLRGYLIEVVIFLSPTIALIYYSFKSTREDQYRDNSRTIKDPGHRRIRIYDQFVLVTSYAVGFFIFFSNNNVFSAETWLAGDGSVLMGGALNIKVITLVTFPQIAGGWAAFLIWSGFFAFLRFYDSRRSKIIRDTNERLGAW